MFPHWRTPRQAEMEVVHLSPTWPPQSSLAFNTWLCTWLRRNAPKQYGAWICPNPCLRLPVGREAHINCLLIYWQVTPRTRAWLTRHINIKLVNRGQLSSFSCQKHSATSILGHSLTKAVHFSKGHAGQHWLKVVILFAAVAFNGLFLAKEKNHNASFYGRGKITACSSVFFFPKQ